MPEDQATNWPQFTEKDVETYSRRIGNLALLLAKITFDLKSCKFAPAKAAYEDNPNELPRMVAREPRGPKDEIVAHQKRLADYRLKAWPS